MAEINPFVLLSVPQKFALNTQAIEEGWRKAIAAVHPDKFANRTVQERRIAEQWAGRINEAKETLLSPVGRAMALLKLQGVDAGVHTDTRMPAQFLIRQMQWREEAEEAAGDRDKLQAILAEIENQRDIELTALTQSLDVSFDAAQARESVRRLMFIEKIKKDIA